MVVSKEGRNPLVWHISLAFAYLRLPNLVALSFSTKNNQTILSNRLTTACPLDNSPAHHLCDPFSIPTMHGIVLFHVGFQRQFRNAYQYADAARHPSCTTVSHVLNQQVRPRILHTVKSDLPVRFMHLIQYLQSPPRYNNTSEPRIS